jgi:hypothetical protein
MQPPINRRPCNLAPFPPSMCCSCVPPLTVFFERNARCFLPWAARRWIRLCRRLACVLTWALSHACLRDHIQLPEVGGHPNCVGHLRNVQGEAKRKGAPGDAKDWAVCACVCVRVCTRAWTCIHADERWRAHSHMMPRSTSPIPMRTLRASLCESVCESVCGSVGPMQPSSHSSRWPPRILSLSFSLRPILLSPLSPLSPLSSHPLSYPLLAPLRAVSPPTPSQLAHVRACTRTA